MENASWLNFAGVVLIAVITSIGTYLVARTNQRAASKTAITPPYEALANRVTKLETEREEDRLIIERLHSQLRVVIFDRDAVVAYVKDLGKWIRDGAKPPPPPVPVHLRDVLDPGEFEVSQVTERTITTTYVTPAATRRPASDDGEEPDPSLEVTVESSTPPNP